MIARKLAAQFAAYTWYENTQLVERTAAEKSRFARKNWQAFLSVADEGLGRLLLKLRRGRRRAKAALACP